jgi:hypothetical protein
MLDQLMEKIAGALTRRRFLARIASGCSTVVLAALGFVKPAYGSVRIGCCFVCSATPCNSVYNLCAGIWCWTCQHKIDKHTCEVDQCTECYSSLVPKSCFNKNGCNSSPLCNKCPSGWVLCSDAIIVTQFFCG